MVEAKLLLSLFSSSLLFCWWRMKVNVVCSRNMEKSCDFVVVLVVVESRFVVNCGRVDLMLLLW